VPALQAIQQQLQQTEQQITEAVEQVRLQEHDTPLGSAPVGREANGVGAMVCRNMIMTSHTTKHYGTTAHLRQ
jgi:hypothetical protein